MAKKLKDYYDKDYVKSLSEKIKNAYPKFNEKSFLEKTSKNLDDLEFNQRQELISNILNDEIDESYKDTIDIFYKILGPVIQGNLGTFTQGWQLWPIGKYVEIYGDDDFETTTKFSYELTKRYTGEYCMRPILENFPKESMKLLKSWSLDENERVRRLSSECLRIRLPWAKKSYVALENFDDYVEILENLKNDKDKSIQKSVANNLNDLYKEDKDKFEYIIDKFSNGDISKETTFIIKHGSRTKNKQND